MIGTVRHSGDGSISWHGHEQVALGPIMFSVNGIRLVVDAAFLDEVIDLAATSAAELRAASAGFADPDAVERIIATDDGAEAPGPVLAGGLARVATVSAVDAIHLGDLDDGVLLLDTAYAHALAGDADESHYALAAAVPDRLVDEIAAADLTGPLVTRVAEALSLAPEEVIGGRERDGLITRLGERIVGADTTWEVLMHEMIAVSPALALDLGDIGVTTDHLADLRALPPRLLRFTDPDESEIDVEVFDDGDVEVSAALRPGVDAVALESAGLFAVAADIVTGDLLASAPATARDGQVHATLALSGLDPQTLRFALLGAEMDLATLRLDPLGVALTRIDRHCRHAWSRHRLAGALRASVGAESAESEILRVEDATAIAHEDARETMETVRALIRQLVRRHRAGPQNQTLAGYRDAVERLAERIDGPPEFDGATGPTVAELYSVAME